jgi:nitrogen fixation protein
MEPGPLDLLPGTLTTRSKSRSNRKLFNEDIFSWFQVCICSIKTVIVYFHIISNWERLISCLYSCNYTDIGCQWFTLPLTDLTEYMVSHSVAWGGKQIQFPNFYSLVFSTIPDATRKTKNPIIPSLISWSLRFHTSTFNTENNMNNLLFRFRVSV